MNRRILHITLSGFAIIIHLFTHLCFTHITVSIPLIITMSKTLAIFGATGQQGGSVLNYVLNDPDLSTQYKLRAITRDPSRPAAKALETKGVEIVQADADDISSLKRALQGTHTVFAVTSSTLDDQRRTREIAQGKGIADTAVAVGASYLIFSTLPHVTRISNGKYTHVDSFDVKAEVEDYIRSLPIKSAFYAPGSFMQNFLTASAPQPVGDGTFVLSGVASPDTKFPLIDPVADSGLYVSVILAEPEKYAGKVVYGVTELLSYNEIVETMSSVSGKTARYNQIPEATFRSYLPPIVDDIMVDLLLYYQDFGYYGPVTDEVVGLAKQDARGGLRTTFEEFLRKNPVPTLNG
jgi:uncharacterized protein YbjT (DUF2867 family)